MAKARRYPVKRSTVIRLEQAVFANAARLLTDACTLYQAGAYPSAYSLSILAFEELGKLEMVDHIGFEAELNSIVNKDTKAEMLEHLFSKKMYYSHKQKQQWGAFSTSGPGGNKRIERYASLGILDLHKQDSLYVGYSNNRLRLPSKFKAFHAYQQIEYALELLEGINDLSFYDVFEESTDETQQKARDVIDPLKALFASLPTPKQLSER